MIPGEYPGMDRWYLENIQEWIDGTRRISRNG